MAERMRGGPLQGIRVVEMTKVWAGPYTGKLLAYLGAEVIKVESQESLDITRSFGVSDKNKAPGFASVNPQKLSVQIDTKTAGGKELMLDLLATADVFVENLRPGAMHRLGLDYQTVRRRRPEIVYVSMGMYGSDGPLSYQTGYAPCFAALGGLSAVVGREGQPPAGMNIRYADSTFGTAAAYAALIALLHRRRSGVGQFIDVSACESMSSMIGDAFMQHALSGQAARCDGNRHADMAPHGVYPCRDGEWIAIAASSETAWQALAAAAGLAQDARFASLAGRKAHEPVLDELIAAWTAQGSAARLAAQLQGAGVAAGKSASSEDLVVDPLLWAREFFVEVRDAEGAVRPTVGPSWKMTRGAAIADAAPRLGQHNAYVLGEILGLSPAEQQRLAEAGVAR